MKYRLISDTHFHHQMLVDIGDRAIGYEAKLIKSLCNIPQEDILIHLGDISIGKDKDIHESYISQIKCKKILVRGNHETKSDNRYYEHGWDFVVNSFDIKFNQLDIHFSHKPEYKEGAINIHGHLHMYKEQHRHLSLEKDEPNRILISCEYSNYQARTLESIIKSHRDRFRIGVSNLPEKL